LYESIALLLTSALIYLQYNETINDLLGSREFDKTKHEVKHLVSPSGAPYTRVTDVTVVPLRAASQLQSVLHVAAKRRRVASTLMNERSSRSHCVFTVRMSGKNDVTGEACEGSLNLVDLAGSERLKEVGHGQNGEGKERLRETQNINRSLSALGDVIAALGASGGSGEKHVPYRNSKVWIFASSFSCPYSCVVYSLLIYCNIH
jgi:kinesin family member C1